MFTNKIDADPFVFNFNILLKEFEYNVYIFFFTALDL